MMACHFAGSSFYRQKFRTWEKVLRSPRAWVECRYDVTHWAVMPRDGPSQPWSNRLCSSRTCAIAGARAADADMLVFVDADTIVSEAAIRAAIAAMRDGAAGGGFAFRFGGGYGIGGVSGATERTACMFGWGWCDTIRERARRRGDHSACVENRRRNS